LLNYKNHELLFDGEEEEDLDLVTCLATSPNNWSDFLLIPVF
jgi:hypothetical protein